MEYESLFGFVHAYISGENGKILYRKIIPVHNVILQSSSGTVSFVVVYSVRTGEMWSRNDWRPYVGMVRQQRMCLCIVGM